MSATISANRSAVYVGTYNKYNNGSIAGDWLDLADFSDYDEFIQACYDLHKNERDPELMPQDWEGIGPDCAEYGVFERVKLLYSWQESGFDLSDEETACAFWAFVGNFSSDADENTPEKFGEAFRGWYDSVEDYAREYLDDCGAFVGAPDLLETYFDFERFANDLQIGGDIWTHDENGRVAIFDNI